MKKYLLLVLCIMLNNPVKAQNDSDCTEHIIMKSGEKLCGHVLYKNPTFGKEHLLLNDTAKIDIAKVKTFQTQDGYYGTVDPGFSFSPKVVRRMKTGKIDFYSATNTTYMPGQSHTVRTAGGSYTTTSSFGSTMTNVYEYYSKDGSDIKKCSYGNLREALADNPASMKLLNEHRTLIYTQVGLVAAGLGTIAATLATMKKGRDTAPPGIFIGAAIAVTSWIPHLMRQGKIEDAIETYNRK